MAELAAAMLLRSGVQILSSSSANVFHVLGFGSASRCCSISAPRTICLGNFVAFLSCQRHAWNRINVACAVHSTSRNSKNAVVPTRRKRKATTASCKKPVFAEAVSIPLQLPGKCCSHGSRNLHLRPGLRSFRKAGCCSMSWAEAV